MTENTVLRIYVQNYISLTCSLLEPQVDAADKLQPS